MTGDATGRLADMLSSFEYERKEARQSMARQLLERLAADLTRRFGRGFSRPNLQQMRQFYQAFPVQQICQMLSDKSPSAGKIHTASAKISCPAAQNKPDSV